MHPSALRLLHNCNFKHVPFSTVGVSVLQSQYAFLIGEQNVTRLFLISLWLLSAWFNPRWLTQPLQSIYIYIFNFLVPGKVSLKCSASSQKFYFTNNLSNFLSFSFNSQPASVASSSSSSCLQCGILSSTVCNCKRLHLLELTGRISTHSLVENWFPAKNTQHVNL